MKAIQSAMLWTMGVAFFAFTFIILSVGLFTMSRKRVFALARFLFTIQTRLMGIRLTVTGLSHIDQNRTYLIMGNHQSLFDLFVVPAAIPLTYVAVEAAYHFSIPLWGSLITRWGCIPIHRNNLEKAKQSLDVARQRLTLLRNGYHIGDIAVRKAAADDIRFDVQFLNATDGHIRLRVPAVTQQGR